jgi:hypothetical protein
MSRNQETSSNWGASPSNTNDTDDSDEVVLPINHHRHDIIMCDCSDCMLAWVMQRQRNHPNMTFFYQTGVRDHEIAIEPTLFAIRHQQQIATAVVHHPQQLVASQQHNPAAGRFSTDKCCAHDSNGARGIHNSAGTLENLDE